MSAPAEARPSREAVLDALSPTVAAIVAEAKAGLDALYGDRLARVVLYGSQARGDARPDSDIDLLVVLHGEIYWYGEIRRMGGLGMTLLLDHGLPVSFQPYTDEAYRTQPGAFMENVREEGVEL